MDFAEAVQDISLRSMVGDDKVVHVLYDVEMGLAGGPLPTAQVVEFVEGAFASVDASDDAAARASEVPEVIAIWEPMATCYEARDGRPGLEFARFDRLGPAR